MPSCFAITFVFLIGCVQSENGVKLSKKTEAFDNSATQTDSNEKFDACELLSKPGQTIEIESIRFSADQHVFEPSAKGLSEENAIRILEGLRRCSEKRKLAEISLPASVIYGGGTTVRGQEFVWRMFGRSAAIIDFSSGATWMMLPQGEQPTSTALALEVRAMPVKDIRHALQVAEFANRSSDKGKSRFSRLMKVACEIERFAKEDDLVWVVQFFTPDERLTEEIWVNATTGRARSQFTGRLLSSPSSE